LENYIIARSGCTINRQHITHLSIGEKIAYYITQETHFPKIPRFPIGIYLGANLTVVSIFLIIWTSPNISIEYHISGYLCTCWMFTKIAPLLYTCDLRSRSDRHVLTWLWIRVGAAYLFL